MRLFTNLSIASLLGVVLIVGAWGHSTKRADDGILRARAKIQGATGSGISGEVLFFQARDTVPAEVLIIARVTGLPPNTLHGFHIHEIGVCTAPAFTAAGGHFDPGPNGNSQPDANHPFHMGDVPNLKVDAFGIGTLQHVTSRVTIALGPLSMFDADGTAVIVHANPDQGITGPAGSGVSGGPRIACGVVEMLP
jgi:superoxide dismutase, Cu-Zn family